MSDDIYVREGLNQTQMAKFAEEWRSKTGTQFGKPVDIIDFLEFDLQKYYPEFQLRVIPSGELGRRAMAVPPENYIAVDEAVYDSACSGDPQARFDLAHELGHFLLHRDLASSMNKNHPQQSYKKQFINQNAHTSSEDQADMFARHLLIPIKLAYSLKDDVAHLSQMTRTPLREAKSAVTISKRTEFYHFVQS